MKTRLILKILGGLFRERKYKRRVLLEIVDYEDEKEKDCLTAPGKFKY